ncbi:sigma factor-like helix-turn-helix DNA-binding protein [Hephaestia mangrovi]|uniref:sigma-70 region 4 domain-containing protein n=1 Tax=Hephaestia mangrovi TaxID=2873268 RepID=UPI001CA72730|nr:sigma-70 region 4 domain-containing protein [Hephaestia mangrovi]MBY8829705.1 sigma-70 region 4 domain-containing protein [Hephaestia mangrovi]
MIAEQPAPAVVETVQAGLQTLRRFDRIVFVAHCVGAMSYPDIAVMTGLGVAEVERRMARALYELDRHRSGYRPPWWRRWLR